MSWPIRSKNEKLSKVLLGAFGNKFGVSERFVVSIIVDESGNIDKDLI
jgi:hypothetical protein